MTLHGWLQIGLYLAALLLLTRPLGVYLYRVYEGDRQPLPKLFGPVERLLYRLSGVNPKQEQSWREYALCLLAFSLFGVLVLYLLLRLQGMLPLNSQKLPGVEPSLAFNTAVSFTTNTNWQSYGGETTLSYLSQMAGLTWQSFVSASAGLGVALCLARGLTRQRVEGQPTPLLGNFWVDTIRGVVYLFLPLCILYTLLLVSQGVIQNFAAYQEVSTLEGFRQVIAMGPTASQEAIKQLGTNGGGFFNANSAHPFENPTAISNFLEMLAILLIPAAQIYAYGKMARDTRQGWAIFGAVALLLVVGIGVAYWAESQGNPILAELGVDADAGNLEGKELRFGLAGSATWAAATTGASNGSVNSMHDSYTPLGGLVPLLNIQLGEVVFGGVGAGLYGALIFVLLAVFLAGLMVGRTPEYLGKKIEAREMKLVMLYVLIFPLIILGFTAWAAVAPEYGLSSRQDLGPHGLTEILYAYSSAGGNNGSAFAGLGANTLWYNTTLGLGMLAGRFLMILPVLAIAGSMVEKRTVPPGPGTFPTNGALFSGLLIAVILIVGALTFFPALSLGPLVEHFLMHGGEVF